MRIRSFRFLVVLLLFVSICVFASLLHIDVVTDTARAADNPLTARLIGLAKAKLDAEYGVLITGDSTKLTKPKFAVSGAAVQGMRDMTTVQLRRNKGLAQHGMHYTKASSTLTIENITVSNETATVTATETVTLTLINIGARGTINTQEATPHIFHYALQTGVWTLMEDDTFTDIPPASPESGAITLTTRLTPLDVNKKAPGGTQSGLRATSPIMPALSGGFNPTSAVTYAKRYWGPEISNYNTAYRVYGNDCTNFVSQAMNWAGWQHIVGWYDDAHNWWYSPNNEIQWGGRAESRSWINATYFILFSRYSGRATDALYLSDFRPGDVLQIDQSPPDNILDHTEIVTTKDSKGDIYLTSHSVNVLDKPFWDIYYQYPGAKYYGTIMKYSY